LGTTLEEAGREFMRNEGIISRRADHDVGPETANGETIAGEDVFGRTHEEFETLTMGRRSQVWSAFLIGREH
jgi:hypothetical protein